MKKIVLWRLVAFALVVLPCVAVQADLVHQYSFSGNADDSVGTAHGTLVNNTGNASYSSGVLTLGNDGTQMSNEGTGDYVDLPNGIISALGNQGTFEAWFTWGTGANYQRLFDFGTSNGGEDSSSSGSASSYVMMTPSRNGTPRLSHRYYNGTSATEKYIDLIKPSTTLQTEAHVVVTWDGANDRATAYVNGTTAGYVRGLLMELSDLIDNNNWLGRAQFNDTMLVGSYNEFRIYDEALTPAQVYKNTQDGPDAGFNRVNIVATELTSIPVHRYSFTSDCTDSIGSADGTLVNTTGLSSFAGGKLTLGNNGTQKSNDGTGDYVDLPNYIISDLEDNATFEAWVTWEAADPTGLNTWQRIFDFGISQGGEGVSDDGANCTDIMATPSTSGSEVRADYRRGDTNEQRKLMGPEPLDQGVESHVVLTWDGDNGLASLYVDGELISVDTTTFNLSEMTDLNNWLGRSQYSADTMLVGDYNEFRIYDYALTAEEILGNYQAGADIVNTQGGIPGDTNGDKIVDETDATMVASNWGSPTTEGPSAGDFNNDGVVDATDASIMAANWGNHNEGEGNGSVPEPGSLILLSLGVLMLAARRRHAH